MTKSEVANDESNPKPEDRPGFIFDFAVAGGGKSRIGWPEMPVAGPKGSFEGTGTPKGSGQASGPFDSPGAPGSLRTRAGNRKTEIRVEFLKFVEKAESPIFPLSPFSQNSHRNSGTHVGECSAIHVA